MLSLSWARLRATGVLRSVTVHNEVGKLLTPGRHPCRLAYDGRGNAVVRSSGDLESAVAALGGFEHGLYAERWCPYQKVCACRTSLIALAADMSVASEVPARLAVPTPPS